MRKWKCFSWTLPYWSLKLILDFKNWNTKFNFYIFCYLLKFKFHFISIEHIKEYTYLPLTRITESYDKARWRCWERPFPSRINFSRSGSCFICHPPWQARRFRFIHNSAWAIKLNGDGVELGHTNLSWDRDGIIKGRSIFIAPFSGTQIPPQDHHNRQLNWMSSSQWLTDPSFIRDEESVVLVVSTPEILL